MRYEQVCILDFILYFILEMYLLPVGGINLVHT